MRVLFTAAGVLATVLVLLFSVLAGYPLTGDQRETVQAMQADAVESLPFGPDARSHLEDVRRVLDVLRILAAALIVVTLWGLSRGAVSRGGAGGALIGLPVLAAALPWEWLFTGMHAALFPQGNWRFPAESLLIRTFPPEFFVSFAVAWGCVCVAAGIAALAIRIPPRPRRPRA